MTEYWKSYAKKFCEICKIWYADNKVSAERHEQGLRHKAMVQQRLRESAKKAKDKEVEDHELRMTLLSMEQAARASFSSREEREVPMVPAPRIITSQKQTAEPTEEDEVKAKLREQKRKLAALKKRSKQSQFWSPDEGEMGEGDLPLEEELADWVQAETSDGQFYYWHIYTGETRWEQPEKFYTSAQYAERYANIVEETTDQREVGQCANSAYDLTQSSNLSIAGTSQTACPELIDPTFVHQMTVAEVNNQMASTGHEAPPPVKKYYGMREKHDGGRPKERQTYGEEDKSNAQNQMLTRDERRKIRRERKAMSDKAGDGTRIPEGLVELKFEAPAAAAEEQLIEGETSTKSAFVSKFSTHPLGPWVPVKKEEKRPDLDSADSELQPHGKKRAKHYDDLPEQSYGPGSADYSQTPAELLEIAEMDPDDLSFKPKQTGQPQKSAKGKAIGFRKPGTSHATKSFRKANKTEF